MSSLVINETHRTIMRSVSVIETGVSKFGRLTLREGSLHENNKSFKESVSKNALFPQLFYYL